MPAKCQITNRGTRVGNTRSHANNKNKRKYKINLQEKVVVNPATGKRERMKLSTKALRTLTKKGLI